MSCWNFGEAVWRIADSPIADRTALIHGNTEVSFAELRRRSAGIASWLRSLGLPEGAHVGHYLRNSNAYMELVTACGLIDYGHVNVNYRYRDQELVDLCNGLDIRVLAYDEEFADRVGAIRSRLGETVAFVEVPARVREGREDSAEIYSLVAETAFRDNDVKSAVVSDRPVQEGSPTACPASALVRAAACPRHRGHRWASISPRTCAWR